MAAAIEAGRNTLIESQFASFVTRTAIETPRPPDVAVHLDHTTRARGLMQTVDVLSYQRKLRKPFLPTGNGFMCRVWLQRCEQVAAIIEPLPNDGKISLQHAGRRDYFQRHALPYSRITASAKRGHA